MRVKYDLADFNDQECETIVDRLRSASIPYLFHEKSILVDKNDEREVEAILSHVGDIHAILEEPNQPTSLPPTLNRSARKESFLSNENVAHVMTRDGEDEPGVIALIGAAIGGGAGILIVIAAFMDPTFEGRIYIFLPAIILAVVGFWLGSVIETGVRRARRRW